MELPMRPKLSRVLILLGGLDCRSAWLRRPRSTGKRQAVAIAGSIEDATRLTAYVATGDNGLALVDASKFTKPTVLSQLDLTGTNTDVAVDAARGIAVVAGNAAGLHIVDVSEPILADAGPGRRVRGSGQGCRSARRHRLCRHRQQRGDGRHQYGRGAADPQSRQLRRQHADRPRLRRRHALHHGRQQHAARHLGEWRYAHPARL